MKTIYILLLTGCFLLTGLDVNSCEHAEPEEVVIEIRSSK
jgi:hypothetical protein